MRLCLITVGCLVALASRGLGQTEGTVDWPGVGNDPGCMRYSRLDRINRENVKLDPNFGRGGVCNLRTELDPKFAALSYGPTSAPAVWNDTIIVGNSSGEGPGIAAPGDIRAFDVRTGKQVWRFRTVPRPGEF